MNSIFCSGSIIPSCFLVPFLRELSSLHHHTHLAKIISSPIQYNVSWDPPKPTPNLQTYKLPNASGLSPILHFLNRFAKNFKNVYILFLTPVSGFPPTLLSKLTYLEKAFFLSHCHQDVIKSIIFAAGSSMSLDAWCWCGCFHYRPNYVCFYGCSIRLAIPLRL